MRTEFPEKLGFLFAPKRYKVAYGGRGGAKSWGFARALLILGKQRPLRILCTRETQKSISESVHHLLKSQVGDLGFEDFYTVKETSLVGANGTEFIFAGLRQQGIANLKSYEDVDICWVEEAQVVTKKSWETLIPTIRKEGSEIWVSFNPELETDETYQRFVKNPPKNSFVVKINWSDNPFFPSVLKDEKDELKLKDKDAYDNVWDGHCKQAVEGAIYKSQIIKAEADNRFCRVPYDAAKPVDTFWDLGFGDSVCIWLVQVVGFEFHLIDFIEGCQADIQHYLKELQERGYIYGTHYLPHDARAKQLAAGGRSIEQQIRSGGRKVEIVPQLSVEDGIAAGRAIFNRCWFDDQKCADGIQALRHYRYQVDETLSVGEKKTFKREPCHDWASHAADSFRYFAVAIKEPRRVEEEERTYNHGQYGEQSWMA
jgi:phage terminase large subunit